MAEYQAHVGDPTLPQYEFSNRVAEDNSDLEDDSGVYWTQDEGAPEDNPGEDRPSQDDLTAHHPQGGWRGSTACGCRTAAS